LVGYPIMHLRAAGLSARAYVRNLEEMLCRTLQAFGLSGLRDDARPGIWIDRIRKIASIGVRIRHGIASHGFSLNVHLDRNPAELVVCCGERETVMVSMQDLVPTPVEMTVVRSALVQAFSQVFARELVPCSREDLPAATGP
jgi:lipoyl(octanoyl) transferase